jgi:dipeptidyl-peptidase-4
MAAAAAAATTIKEVDANAMEQPDPSTTSKHLTLDDIFLGPDFKSESYSQPRWWEEGSFYTTLAKTKTKKKDQESSTTVVASSDRELIWHDASKPGESKVYVSSDLLIPPGGDKPLVVDDYALSSDQSRMLIFTNSRKVWRKKTRGDYWVLDITARDLRQLGGDVIKTHPSSLMFATFSPSGDKVCYVRENNIYVQDLHTFEVTVLTSDGSDTLINGTFDWVYEEELQLRCGFRWSPDSKSIAFWQLDQTGVRVVHLINNTDHLYPKIVPIPYPKAGEQNASCRVGVLQIDGSADGEEAVTWLDVPGDPREHYIASLDWIAESGDLVLQQLNRLQNTVHVMTADPTSGTVKIAFTDRDDAWLDLQSGAFLGSEASAIRFLKGGTKFLWLSDRNGWRQLFLVDRHSGEMVNLTSPTFDVTEVAGIDEEGGWAYYMASPDDPLRRYLFRTKLDGSAHAERITPVGMTGTHGYRMSRDAKFAIHVHSNIESPESTEIVRLSDHKVLMTLADNKSLRENLKKAALPEAEFFRISIDEGVDLDGYCIKPPSFDPEKKYPVLFHVYGEPAMQVVRDMWGGRTGLWHRILAQKGYVIIAVDNRGTPAPRGRVWRKCVYRQIGILAPEDQAKAARALLAERSYLDPARVAIWGWSGGGSMSLNAIFRHPDLYKTAMCIAPVPNQRGYDTIYQVRTTL